MTESAYEWGVRHGSCQEALDARQALGPQATQADWWRVCPRGDWLIWQLQRLPAETQRAVHRQMMHATEVIVTSAIVAHALDCGVPVVEEWAAKWLSGEDRSAWEAAAAAAAWAAEAAWEAEAELQRQADDIRAEIPDWPGEIRRNPAKSTEGE